MARENNHTTVDDSNRNNKNKRFSIHDAFEEDEEDESLGIKVYGSTVVTTPVQSKNRSTNPQDVTIRVANDARTYKPGDDTTSRDSDSLIQEYGNLSNNETNTFCWQHPKVRENWRTVLLQVHILIEEGIVSVMETLFEPSSIDRMDISVSDTDSDSDSDSDIDSTSDSDNDSVSDSDSDTDAEDRDSDSGSDNSESCIYESNEETIGLCAEIAKFVAMSRSRTRHVDSFLHILRNHCSKETPKCYSTLMSTPKYQIEQRDVGEGKYFHYGIAKNLLMIERLLKTNIFANSDVIILDIGIDGASPLISSKLSLWPIMGALVNMPLISPFLIGSYGGQGDFQGKDTDEFLRDFCDELEILEMEGIELKCGLKKIVVRLFSMDCPARAKICNVMGHASHEGCPLCAWNTTVFAGKAVYPNKVGDHIRTDETFKLRLHLDHHHAELQYRYSRLESLGFKMVSQFPIDPMHCIDLGIVLKCLELLILMVPAESVNEISRRLTEFKFFRPSEFARDCRPLNYLSKYKATELRQFLLYGSPVFLKGVVSEKIYNHWLLLHTAVRLLSNTDHTPNCIDFAEKLIERFVRDYPKIYGKYSITFNVHVLLHIPYYVRKYGSLDSFSTYKFENFIQRIKKWVAKGTYPLQQIHNRMEERFRHYPESLIISKFNKLKIKCNGKDSYVAVKHDGQIIPAKVIKIEKRHQIKYIYAVKCLNVCPLFMTPIDSSEIGEITYGGLSTSMEKYNLSDIQFKYCRIPYDNIFALSPVLHSTFKKFFH